MAHKCVACGKIYESTSQEILKGCNCGSKYFFFFKNSLKIEEETEKFTKTERHEIIQELNKIFPSDIDKPVILNLENIKIKKPGKFEIDLVSLFRREPVVYRLEDGKYFIDLASSFQIRLKNKE